MKPGYARFHGSCLGFWSFGFPWNCSLDYHQWALLELDKQLFILLTIEVIKGGFIFDSLPNSIDMFDNPVRQRACIQALERLFELLVISCPYNDAIAMITLQWRVILDPAVRKVGSRAPCLLGRSIPLLQRFEVSRLGIQFEIHLPNRHILIEPTGPVQDLLLCLDQGSAGKWRISVKCHVKFVQSREKCVFLPSRNWRVVALIDARLHIAVVLAVLVDLFNKLHGVVGQAEALKQALLVYLLDAGERIRNRNGIVGRMKVEDVYLRDVQISGYETFRRQV